MSQADETDGMKASEAFKEEALAKFSGGDTDTEAAAGSLAEFLDEFDLGEGGYAIAPAREAKTAIKRLLEEKRGRR